MSWAFDVRWKLYLVKKSQLDAQLILSIFLQPLSVVLVGTNCCMHKVVPSDDGSIYARNM